LGIYTWLNLIEHYPIRYVDRSQFYKIGDLHPEIQNIQIRGKLVNIEEVGGGKKSRLIARLRDDTGLIELIWFKGIKYVKPTLKPGLEYVVFGKPTLFNNRFNVSHPEIIPVVEWNKKGQKGLQAIYPSTEKLKVRYLDSKGIGKLMDNLLVEVKGKVEESLPDYLIQAYKLMSRDRAFLEIHQPENNEIINKAKGRLKFDELFYVQMRILKSKVANKKKFRGAVFKEVGASFNKLYNEILPFDLTGAQKRVIKDVRRDVASGYHMNRLIQGDVGSGKTLVALMSMLLAIDNGFQTCLMAPTEILAQQHHIGIQELVAPLGIEVKLLTGSSKTKERREIHEKLESGELKILIGTHALIEDKVKFKNLALAVIDEQHRFGVAQRSKLWKKNTTPPHILVMTATPIPRTLAMTLYGDLDTSVIDELPPGRKPIVTRHFKDSQRIRVLSFMKQQIDLGRQVYVVYPLIEESENMDYKDLMDGYESMSRYFPKPTYQLSIVHGRMKSADKDFEMQQFAQGKTQIMVATTVIEVGVNVPNASVMVIESAERFGLSQLHQLRGRVGRGREQSFCMLMTGYKLSKESKTRMETMVRTNDGFELSEVDMKLRGPGNIEGTQQSGLMEMKIANIVQDGKIVSFARAKALEILEADPDLIDPKNQIIYEILERTSGGKITWGRIS
jgi:ATP-dependent DNA helicase RecG|tara:strand:+ start:7536 stop:9560 length:2025 start_codon:yes stop_codon:yes gene_type:complete